MRSVLSAVVICCLASALTFSGLQAADAKKDPAPPVAPTAAEIPDLVKQLGDEDYAKRTSAEAKLTLAGPAAEVALLAVKDSQDQEVRTRATRLLGSIKTDPILKKMEAAGATGQSMEADIIMSMRMMQMKTDVKSHYKGMADGKHFSMDMQTNANGTDMKMRMISDGKTVWTETTMPEGAPAVPGFEKGKVMVQKYSLETMEKLNGGKSMNPMDQTKEMRKMFAFTDVKEQKIGGDEVYVLEGSLKAEQADPNAKVMFGDMKRARIAVQKSNMVLRKMEMLDDKGEALMTTDVTNIKLGEKFDEKTFSYTPPAGAQVQDLDEMLKKAGQDQNGAQLEN